MSMALKPIEVWNSEQVKLWQEQARLRRATGIQCPSCPGELLREQDFTALQPPQMFVTCSECGYSTNVIAPFRES